MKKQNKGITLVALVITIILLLILAGITISQLTGSGLFEKAKEAAEKSKKAQEQEQQILDEYMKQINGESLPENTKDTDAGTIVKNPVGWDTQTVRYISTETGVEVTEGEKVATVYAVAVGNGKEVPVPYGFYYVGGDLDTGVIISDKQADKYEKGKDKTTHEYAPKLVGNQFVFIPCTISDYKKIYFGADYDNAEWDRETNTAEYAQIEKYGGFYIGRYEAGVSTLNETTGSFEDSVTFSNSASLFNAVAIQTGINSLGWQNYNFIARGNVITDSNYPNKATGNIVIKANSIPYYHADYYTAVEMTRRLYNTSYVQSGLVTGTQWDMMMEFISDKTDYSDVKSTNWGNYTDTSLTDLRGYYTNVTSAGATDGFKTVEGVTQPITKSSYILLTTGSTDQVMKKNLYDVAGNLWEWTQEASYVDNLDYNTNHTYNSYMLRGGSFGGASATTPACYRASAYAPTTNAGNGFRAVLYMK